MWSAIAGFWNEYATVLGPAAAVAIAFFIARLLWIGAFGKNRGKTDNNAAGSPGAAGDIEGGACE